jgi:hypothetical protein
VVTEVGRGPTAKLEACIVGVGSQRHAALADVARNWVTLVGPPVLSVLHARPVLEAAHFAGQEAWGVPRGHGFLGPLAGRGIEGVLDLEALLEEPLFTGAVELAPDGLLHLVKVTLNVTEGPRWRRNLEIDGHAAARADDDWNLGTPAPPTQVICTRFAVFWRADRHPSDLPGVAASASTDRARPTSPSLDDAIERFVDVFRESSATDPDAAAGLLRSQGTSPELAGQIGVLVPLAFGRLVLARVGVDFANDYVRVADDGTRSPGLLLDEEPVYQRAMLLAPSYAASPRYERAFQDVCQCSGEVSIVGDALDRGDDPETLSLGPPVISEGAMGEQAIRHVADAITVSAKRAAIDVPKTKRWWQFWK